MASQEDISNDIQEDLKRTAQLEAVSLGTTIRNRYQVISYLGRGGMSTVYKALDTRSGRTVALKILHTELLSDTNRVQRFMQEAQTYRDLRHRHIVKTYDFFTDEENRYCLVMEYHEGRNLSQVLSDAGRLTVRRAVKVFSEICDALDHAHSRGIVHRDLKPSNIALVEKDSDIDYVKVLDFGIAKIMPQDDETRLGLTQTGEIVGSPLYMSPEQCMAKKIDHRSDVYSLGCLMYEALVGQPPLMGGNVYETFHLQTHERPRPLGDVRAEYKSGTHFEHIILKCMAKNPKHRYQTMAELKIALAEVGTFKQKSAIDNVTIPIDEWQVRSRAQKGKGIPAYIAAGVTAVVILSGVWMCKDQIRVLIEPAEARYEDNLSKYLTAFYTGDYQKAAEYGLAALQIAENERQNWLKPSLLNLVDVYRISGKQDNAKTLYIRAMELEKKGDDQKLAAKSEKRLITRLTALSRSNPDDTMQIEDLCFQLTDRADSYVASGKLENARKLLVKVNSIAKKSLPEKNPVTPTAVDSLALMSLKNNLKEDYEQIEKLLINAIATREKIGGKESSGLIRTLEALSEVDRRQGKLKDALSNAQRALSIARNAYRSTSLQAALSQCQIAEVYLAMKKPSTASSALSTALASMDKLSESDDIGQARCHILLGEAKLKQQKYSDAMKEFEKGLELVKEGSNQQVLLLARALTGFGDVFDSPAKRQFSEAEGYYKRALVILFRSPAREEARVLDILDKLADIYREQHKADQIVDLYLIVEEMDKATGKAKGVIEDRQLIAKFYQEKRKFEKASSYFETALEQSQQFYGVNNAKTCELMALLADVYMRDNKYQRAAPLIDEAYKMMKSPKLEGKVSRKVKLRVLSTFERYLEKSKSTERLKKVKEEQNQLFKTN